MNKFTEAQRQIFLQNPNVLKMVGDQFQFNPDFKIHAIKQHMNGVPANEIFANGGFDPEMFKVDYFRYLLKRWKKKYQDHGEKSFYINLQELNTKLSKGRNDLDNLSVDDLKALVYIQGEIIEEIKKKKALAKKSFLK